jgi:hypothetical protein
MRLVATQRSEPSLDCDSKLYGWHPRPSSGHIVLRWFGAAPAQPSFTNQEMTNRARDG